MSKFSVRDDIERSIKELGIGRIDFYEVSKLQWDDVLSSIIDNFVMKTHYSQGLHWAWGSLKEPIVSLMLKNEDFYKYIEYVIEDNSVWFIAEDTYGKMWVYEGKPQIISKIIGDSFYIEEYYLASKKFEWILCQNHHGIVYGSGEKIVEKIKNFENTHTDLIQCPSLDSGRAAGRAGNVT